MHIEEHKRQYWYIFSRPISTDNIGTPILMIHKHQAECYPIGQCLYTYPWHRSGCHTTQEMQKKFWHACLVELRLWVILCPTLTFISGSDVGRSSAAMRSKSGWNLWSLIRPQLCSFWTNKWKILNILDLIEGLFDSICISASVWWLWGRPLSTLVLLTVNSTAHRAVPLNDEAAQDVTCDHGEAQQKVNTSLSEES